MIDKIVEKIVSGDMRTIARFIRDIDDGMPRVLEILKALYPHTGKSYVIGITGAPGVGKSTLVDQITFHLRSRNKTVGVLAVDPTSPFSGGAILGDRVRMQRHSMDDGVFIRSLATRGQFGGLTQSTRGAIDVLDAMGKDYILLETVGVGQDEVDVAKNVHTTVIVVIPGMGDDIQATKAGILETGDIFVINKADREGAKKTRSDLQLMLDLDKRKYEEGKWRPPILFTQAIRNEGVVKLLNEIDKHQAVLAGSEGQFRLRSVKERVREELVDMMKNRLIEKVINRIVDTGEFEAAVDSIADGKSDPYSVCDNLVLPKLAL
jgi:GTPase